MSAEATALAQQAKADAVAFHTRMLKVKRSLFSGRDDRRSHGAVALSLAATANALSVAGKANEAHETYQVNHCIRSICIESGVVPCTLNTLRNE